MSCCLPNPSCGACRPKKSGDSKSAPITFADVAGVDTAREELLEVVACLRDARRYSRLNAKTPSGVLLCGPPGTGKTLLGTPPGMPLGILLRVPFRSSIGNVVRTSILPGSWFAGAC